MAELINLPKPALTVPHGGVDPQVIIFLESVKERLESLSGDRGFPRHRSPTILELENAGIIETVVRNGVAYLSLSPNFTVKSPAASNKTPVPTEGNVGGPIATVGGGAQEPTSFYETRYKRSSSTPATPSGRNPSGWTTSVPVSDLPLWWVFARVQEPDDTLITSWSTPHRLLNTSTQNLTVRKNKNSFTNTSNGDMYVHGFNADGDAADIDGSISYDGDVLSVPKVTVNTSQPCEEGWLVMFIASGWVGAAQKIMDVAPASKWQIESGGAWVDMGAAIDDYIVVGSYRAASAGLISNAVMLGNALDPYTIPVQGATRNTGGLADLDQVDSPEIVNDAVGASALAATITLSTLFRTLGTGKRVELEGNHAYPFWIGTSTKNATNGLVYYDQVANEFVITGKLVASKVKIDTSTSFQLVTENDKASEMASMSSTLIGSGAYLTTSWSAVGSATEYLHPSDTSTTATWKKLSLEQGAKFFIQGAITLRNLTSTSKTAYIRYQYRYGASGLWASSGTLFSIPIQGNSNYTMLVSNLYTTKSSTWGTKIEFRYSLKASASTALVADDTRAFTYVANVGTQNGGVVLT